MSEDLDLKDAGENDKKKRVSREDPDMGSLGILGAKISAFFRNLNKSQKISVLIPLGICALILAIHNPFGGYKTTRAWSQYPRGIFTETWDNVGFFNYQSRNCSFEAVDEIGEVAGMMMPLIIFSGIAVQMLKTKDGNER